MRQVNERAHRGAEVAAFWRLLLVGCYRSPPPPIRIYSDHRDGQMRTNPQAGTEPMLLAFAWSPDEADRREPIMMVSTDSIEVRDMRCHLNVPPLGLCEALSDGPRGGGKTNAAMYQAFMELVDAGRWTKQVVKPRSKRGQRVRRWR